MRTLVKKTTENSKQQATFGYKYTYATINVTTQV